MARECIFRAFNLGITYFDLANNYGRVPGRAETVVGRILCEMPREELIISTRAGDRMWPVPYDEGSSRKCLIAGLDQSLQRLGLDYVDIYYSHRFDPETPLDETLGALEQVVRHGEALYIGVSNCPAVELVSACQLTERKSWAPITMHQPRSNLLDREIEKELLPATHEAGVGIIAFSPSRKACSQPSISIRFRRTPGRRRFGRRSSAAAASPAPSWRRCVG